MKNKCFRIPFIFLIVFSLMFSICPISVFADNVTVLDMPCARPHVDNNSGYIEVYWENSSGNSYVDIYAWTFTPLENSSNQDFLPSTNQVLCSLVISNHNVNVSFRANDYCDGYFAGTYMSSVGDYNLHCMAMDGTTSPHTFTIADSSYTCKGVHFYGNVQTVNGTLSQNKNFSVLYAEESSINTNLGGILNYIKIISDYITSQSDEELLEKLDDIIEEIQSVQGKIDDAITSINDFKGSFDDFIIWYKIQINNLLSYCDSFFYYLKDIDEWMPALDNQLSNLYSLLNEVWLIELDSNGKLYEIKDTLDDILEVLNSGKEDPTLKDPNQGIDEAFSDVNGWFDGMDNFGDELAGNMADNSENLANAGTVISGFFSVVPPQIIIALSLCAILIVVAKIIGR